MVFECLPMRLCFSFLMAANGNRQIPGTPAWPQPTAQQMMPAMAPGQQQQVAGQQAQQQPLGAPQPMAGILPLPVS